MFWPVLIDTTNPTQKFSSKSWVLLGKRKVLEMDSKDQQQTRRERELFLGVEFKKERGSVMAWSLEIRHWSNWLRKVSLVRFYFFPPLVLGRKCWEE